MLTLKQLKTKSYLDGDKKCWTITTPDGEEFDCQPAGQRYTCDGVEGGEQRQTIKEIKLKIVNGDVLLPAEDDDELEEGEERAEPTTRALWECVPLGALLIDRLGADACEADLQVMESLDSGGWLLKDGDLMESDTPIDMAKVRRAFDRYMPPISEATELLLEIDDVDDVDDDAELADDEVADPELAEVPPVRDTETP